MARLFCIKCLSTPVLFMCKRVGRETNIEHQTDRKHRTMNILTNKFIKTKNRLIDPIRNGVKISIGWDFDDHF